MFKYEKHIFICENQRPPQAPKKSCGNHGADTIRLILKEKITKLGLNAKIRINKAGCLGRCRFGPTMVIYPRGIWYGGVRESDVDEILQKSILNDEIIDRLAIGIQDEKTATA